MGISKSDRVRSKQWRRFPIQSTRWVSRSLSALVVLNILRAAHCLVLLVHDRKYMLHVLAIMADWEPLCSCLINCWLASNMKMLAIFQSLVTVLFDHAKLYQVVIKWLMLMNPSCSCDERSQLWLHAIWGTPGLSMMYGGNIDDCRHGYGSELSLKMPDSFVKRTTVFPLLVPILPSCAMAIQVARRPPGRPATQAVSASVFAQVRLMRLLRKTRALRELQKLVTMMATCYLAWHRDHGSKIFVGLGWLY